MLHLHRTAHRSVNAVKGDEKGVASGVDQPTAILVDGRVDQTLAEAPEPVKRSYVIPADQARVGVMSFMPSLPPPLPRADVSSVSSDCLAAGLR